MLLVAAKAIVLRAKDSDTFPTLRGGVEAAHNYKVCATLPNSSVCALTNARVHFFTNTHCLPAWRCNCDWCCLVFCSKSR